MLNRHWEHTGEAVTLESARQRLEQQKVDGQPIYILWRRQDRDGKGGGWDPAFFDCYAELIGTTAKSLRVRDYYNHTTTTVVPRHTTYVKRTPPEKKT